MVDREIGSLTPEQTRLLWQDYQQRKQLAPQLQANFPQRRPIDEPSPHRVFVKNESGEQIPAFACMQITGMVDEVGRALLTVDKPNSICAEYLFNSPYAIEPGGYGWGYSWGVVRMLGSAGTYEKCKRYTAQADSWSVAEGPGPFLVYGSDGQIPGTVWGRIVGDHCKARWIVFDFTSGEENTTVEPTDFWDGPDPQQCGDVEVEYPFGEPLCDAKVAAYYDPNTDKYKAIITESAMLGEPVTQEVMTDLANDDCGVEISKLEVRLFPNSCSPSPTTSVVELGTETPTVASVASDSCGTLSVAIQPIRGWICGNTINVIQVPINFDGVLFVYAANFGPPPCTDAVYRIGLNVGLSTWQLVTPCSAGCTSTPPALPDPIPTVETFATVACSANPNSLCGLNLELKTICQDTYYTPATTLHVPLPLQAREVMVDVDGTDKLYETHYVCNYDNQRTEPLDTTPCVGGSSGGG